jgi:hypothetical protein
MEEFCGYSIADGKRNGGRSGEENFLSNAFAAQIRNKF